MTHLVVRQHLKAYIAVLGLVLAAAPAAAQTPALPAEAVRAPANVRITARILVVDRQAMQRAGLAYVVLGGNRVRLESTGGGRAGARIDTGVLGVRAFLDVARQNRWVRSESTQQITTLSGSEAMMSSGDLVLGPRTARSRGPVLAVVPTVQPDGTVHMIVSARLEDVVVQRGGYGRGYGLDASPVAVETDVVARDGEEVVVASGSVTESARAAGLLYWTTDDRTRDILVVITPTVLR